MSELVIDQGNSFTKLTLFENAEIIFHTSLSDDFLEPKIEDVLKEYQPTAAIFSSVRKNRDLASLQRGNKMRWLTMSSQLLFPFSSSYLTPETVGFDRLANAAAAVRKFPQQNALVVDCGTCITYTCVIENSFVGGTIAPGIHMRYKALNHFTGGLPLLSPTGELPPLIGDSTELSVRSGVERAIVAETESIIEQYCSKINDLVVIITGGSIQFFEQHLKSPIFAAPYLTPEGLHEILLLNDH